MPRRSRDEGGVTTCTKDTRHPRTRGLRGLRALRGFRACLPRAGRCHRRRSRGRERRPHDPRRAGAGAGPRHDVPLEVYVARVLAGEGRAAGRRTPRSRRSRLRSAPTRWRMPAATAATASTCATRTHCQVPRAATRATRRGGARHGRTGSDLATAHRGSVLLGLVRRPFESRRAGLARRRLSVPAVAARRRARRGCAVDVRADAAGRGNGAQRDGFRGPAAGRGGRRRNASGRVARCTSRGCSPTSSPAISSGWPSALPGCAARRSRSNSADRPLRFTGRGYGHGVGMCVIGAGRRAVRGESVRAILAQYYPGLEMTPLQPVTASATVGRALPGPPGEPGRARPTTASAPRSGIVSSIVALVPPSSPIANADVVRLAARTHADLAAVLGTSIAPLTVRVHESLESFRLATGRPWWVSSVSDGTSIDLAPAAVLAQRDGFDAALRVAVAELLVADGLKGRPAWVRVGAARYFARRGRRGVEWHAPHRRPRSMSGRCRVDAGDLRHRAARRRSARRSLLRARVRANEGLASSTMNGPAEAGHYAPSSTSDGRSVRLRRTSAEFLGCAQ